MEWAFQWNWVLYFLVSTVTVHNWITVVISPDTQSDDKIYKVEISSISL